MKHIPTQLDHGFEYIGGDLSTDFVNTRSGRYEPPGHDHVQGYADLVGFAREAGVLAPADAKLLLLEAQRRPEKATQIHRRGIWLREAIWGAFSRLAQGKGPDQRDLDVISREAAAAFGKAQVVRSGDRYTWEWPTTDDLARPLWSIARAASDLLVNDEDRQHLRECADGTCAWLFVDRTKNHSRRWCDMEKCGSRNKVRAFRQRRARVTKRAR